MRNRAALFAGMVMVGWIAGLQLSAAPPSNPYRIIATRNAFDLQPVMAPEPVKLPEPPPEPKGKIFLTGVVNFSGPKAFLQLEDPKTRKTEFLPPLAVGERYKAITILAIDPLTQTVRIRHEQAEDLLDFRNDGLKPSVAPDRPLPVRSAQRPAPFPPPPIQALPTASVGARAVIVAGGGQSPPGAAPSIYQNGNFRRAQRNTK